MESKENNRTIGEQLIYGRMPPGKIEEVMHHIVPEAWMRLLRASRRAPSQMTDKKSRHALQEAISEIDSTFIHIQLWARPR